ncbi:MAG: CotH kinase family protein [Myxococcota bacterium]|nr:CotH kinase family protein [Myxococcota bacterium]
MPTVSFHLRCCIPAAGHLARQLGPCLLLIALLGCDSSGAASETNGPLQGTDFMVSDGAQGTDLDQSSAGAAADGGTERDQFTSGTQQDEFYDREQIQHIEITIAPADRQRMFDALPERVYVPARFRWNDIEIDNVGVRFKGNSSSNPDGWWKRSLLIKFGEFVDDQRFLGLRRVALDNAVQFGSVFSERLITDILRNEGIHCSRANYAEVTINGVFDGLFVNVERIDKSFLQRVFGNRDGVLYKNHVGGPGSDFRVLDDPSEYAQSFEPKTHKNEADFSELYDLSVLLRDTPDDDLEARLESIFELESFIKLMAVMVFSGAFDQYTGQAPHNFYIYNNPETGRLHYLPWDLDVGFADNAFGRIPVIDGWNASWPLLITPRPLIERILSNGALRRRYLRHAERILERYFRPEILGMALDTLYQQATESLSRDPYPPRRVTVQSDTNYPGIVQSLKAFMVRRYQTARRQLDSPLSEPPPSATQRREPMPGEPGPDDPTDLRVERIDQNGVTLSWTDNSDREGLTILQRCDGVDCENFSNRMGIEPDRPPRATDQQVQMGQVYRYRVYAAWPSPDGPQGSAASNIVEARP